MKIKHLSSLFLIIIIGLLYLAPKTALSQKILALDKPGKVKRVRYKINDFISLKTIENQRIKGHISHIYDSSFQIEDKIIELDKIKYIRKTKNSYGWGLLSKISSIISVGYLSLDVTNRFLNNDKPIILQQTAINSSIFMGFSITSTIINNRKYKINNRRHLKIIDLNISP